MKNELVLLDNHLEFLRAHRGTVTKQVDHWLVESDKKEFTFLIVGPTPIAETVHQSTFYKTPWSGESNASWLKSNKKHNHTLSSMILLNLSQKQKSELTKSAVLYTKKDSLYAISRNELEYQNHHSRNTQSERLCIKKLFFWK